MSLLANVRVCGAIPPQSVAFIFVEQTDVSLGDVINDTPNAFCIVGDYIRHTTAAPVWICG
jgi:hypothetical protein